MQLFLMMWKKLCSPHVFTKNVYPRVLKEHGDKTQFHWVK